MSNLINNFDDCTTTGAIVLHDFRKRNFDHKEWIAYCVELMNQYGLVPTHMGISAPSLKSEKMNAFEREFKKLDKVVNQSITSICIQATMHGLNESPKTDLFSCNFDIDPKQNRTTFVLTISDSVHVLVENDINQITTKLCDFFNPGYGYYYQRLAIKGPRWYACGVAMGLEIDEPERVGIDAWGEKFRTSNEYQTGDLRDIYQMNLLMDAHLDREIMPDTTLRSFIESNPLHGLLSAVDEQRTAWWIEVENIAQVREALRPSGIIVAG
jgi:hypothetical protein